MRPTCIYKDQVEDFTALLKEAGRDAAEFDITDVPDPITSSRIVAETGTVTVTHRNNNIARSYAVGLQSKWWSAAANDVIAGKFDQPRS